MECTEIVSAIISNRLPSNHFSLNLVSCLHQKDCVVWKHLLGCSLTAYWWKTARVSSEQAEATRPRSLGNSCYCTCKSCGSQVFLLTLKGNCRDLLHISSAMRPCWLSLQLGPVSIVPVLLIATVKHPGELQLDCDGDSAYRVSVCCSLAICNVQDDKIR